MPSQEAGRSAEGTVWKAGEAGEAGGGWGKLRDSATLVGPPVCHIFPHGGHSARRYPKAEPVSPSTLGVQSLSLARLWSIPGLAHLGPWWAPKVFSKLLFRV